MSFLLLGAAMFLVGAGTGRTLQNFGLVVRNAVPQRDIGAASSTVTFFRSLGGTIGVTVLGAVVARSIADGVAAGESVPQAYGEATGTVFLISAGIAALGIVVALSLRPVTLRASLDLADDLEAAATAAEAADGAPAVDQVEVDARRR